MVLMRVISTSLVVMLAACSGSDEQTQEPITAADIKEIEDESLEQSSGTDFDSEASIVEEDFGPTPGDALTDESSDPLDASLDSTLGSIDDIEPEKTTALTETLMSDSAVAMIADAEPFAPPSAVYSSDAPGVYVVQRGDTLGKIARRVLGKPGLWRGLAATNGLSGTTTIFPGQVLRFDLSTSAAKSYHDWFVALPRAKVTVKKGDTLSKIAKRLYGDAGHWRVLSVLNSDKISSPDKIFVGMTLSYVKPKDFTSASL